MVRVVIQVHPCSSKFILIHWRLIWIKKMEWLMDPPRNLFFAFLSSLFSPLRFLSFCLLSFFPSCSYLWSSLFILVQFHSTKFVCLFVFLSFCLSVFLFSTKSCFKAKNTHFGKFRTPRPPHPPLPFCLGFFLFFFAIQTINMSVNSTQILFEKLLRTF